MSTVGGVPLTNVGDKSNGFGVVVVKVEDTICGVIIIVTFR